MLKEDNHFFPLNFFFLHFPPIKKSENLPAHSKVLFVFSVQLVEFVYQSLSSLVPSESRLTVRKDQKGICDRCLHIGKEKKL